MVTVCRIDRMLNIVGYKCSVLETVTSRPTLSVAV